jgi:hypothetical protein
MVPPPPAVRVGSIAVVWFSYAILVLDLNSLDSGSRSAKLIWTACLVGAGLTAGVDLGLRPKLRSCRPANCQHPSSSRSGGAGFSAANC